MKKEENSQLPLCAFRCLEEDFTCNAENCRYWIDYPEDNNCSLVSIYKNGRMTLEEVAKRLKISLVRVSQIEKKALKRMHKKIKI